MDIGLKHIRGDDKQRSGLTYKDLDLKESAAAQSAGSGPTALETFDTFQDPFGPLKHTNTDFTDPLTVFQDTSVPAKDNSSPPNPALHIEVVRATNGIVFSCVFSLGFVVLELLWLFAACMNLSWTFTPEFQLSLLHSGHVVLALFALVAQPLELLVFIPGVFAFLGVLQVCASLSALILRMYAFADLFCCVGCYFGLGLFDLFLFCLAITWTMYGLRGLSHYDLLPSKTKAT